MSISSQLRHAPRSLLFASALALSFSGPAVAQHADHAAGNERLGTVNFPISCNPTAQQAFNRAVAMLHSFFYPETVKAFTALAEAEPSCAMAYWGVAISQRPNPLVAPFPPDLLKRGWEAIEKARAASSKTEREGDWIEALATFFQDWDKVDQHTRTLAYEAAMARLHDKFPADDEATIFYALALNEAEDLSDKTYARQLKATSLLDPMAAKYPDHPGIAHYIIHSYDYAPLAEKGLPAARRYAEVAPTAPHALHMPSHIFSMVGLWQDSIKANVTGKAASKAYAAKFYPGAVDGGQLHAMDFLEYAYLQGAQDQQAKAILDERNAVEKFAQARLPGDTAFAAIPVRYAIERGAWVEAAALAPRESQFPYAEAIIHFGRALGAARSGDAAAANRDIAELEARRAKLQEAKQGYWVGQIEIHIAAARAWAAKAEGRSEAALALMREAAAKDDASEKHVAMENRLVPMRELLAEMLLEAGQPAIALQEFEASLKIAPNRFRSFVGAAKAAESAGDAVRARSYRERLVELCSVADTERPELVAAKQALVKN
jgi:hypothetical protein